MSLRTMEDQAGQMGGESGSAWPGPNLPAVAATYSLGFSSYVCPDTIEAAAPPVYKLMMIGSHKNNTGLAV